ncbi:MAG: AraC family transcriptional regulator [Planctomycetaceae bacterium]|nr:AraC family transcriptional regulator [Planctomycetaceae bacterium]
MPVLTNYPSPDLLSEVLQAVTLRSVVFCRCELRSPWGFHVPKRDMTGFHVITEGHCRLEVSEPGLAVEVAAGDLLFFPHGHAHVMRDPPTAPTISFQQALEENPLDQARVFRGGGSGCLTSLICGEFVLEDRQLNPLLAALPPLVLIRGSEGNSLPWLRVTLDYVREEVQKMDPGAEAVLTRLADVLLIQSLRAYFQSLSDAPPGWLAGLKDPQIGTALSLIHRRYSEPWTVASLARELPMSRSAFSERFKALVGEPPLAYLARWRLHAAARMLRSTSAKLAQVARRVGYESEVAFHKAFKRVVGLPPGEYRRRMRNNGVSTERAKPKILERR